MRDFWEEWQFQDAVTTTVNALGYGIWELRLESGTWSLELTDQLDEDACWELLSQLPVDGDYCGKGSHGARFCLF